MQAGEASANIELAAAEANARAREARRADARFEKEQVLLDEQILLTRSQREREQAEATKARLQAEHQAMLNVQLRDELQARRKVASDLTYRRAFVGSISGEVPGPKAQALSGRLGSEPFEPLRGPLASPAEHLLQDVETLAIYDVDITFSDEPDGPTLF